ncbi:hypothetical protein BS17DRAFT_843829 [Gyrodon lividus]|nr:hypothetical protein BS17DRAFT_843829 [Gyrodon lividus]
MPTPAGAPVTNRITHAFHPRTLVFHDRKGWHMTNNPNVTRNQPYITTSYRQNHFYQRRKDDEGCRRERAQKDRFIDMVRDATIACGHHACWLHFECLGETSEEQNLDLYSMSDVYRGAEFTLILLRRSDNPHDYHSTESWRHWGGRDWTLPEALLSSKLCYKIGFDGPVIPLSLHALANKAYEHHDQERANKGGERYSQETAIVNAYSGREPLERLERLPLLKAAI